MLDMATCLKLDQSLENSKNDFGITDFARGWRPAFLGFDVENWQVQSGHTYLVLKFKM